METLEENVINDEEVKENKNILGTEKISKLIKKFSVPCIISLLVSSLYNIVDQIFIGQGVGYLGNTATNVVFPITVISLAFALMIGDGAAAYMSLNLGRNDKKSAKQGIGNSITLIGILGVLFFIFGFIFNEQLLKIFGVTEKSYKFAKDYMMITVIGLPFFMISNTLNSMIRADGSPKDAMKIMLIGAVLNIILDPIAIFVLHWSVKGAAIATIVGQIVSFVFSILYIRKFKTINLEKNDFKPKFKIIKKIMSLGVSSFITEVAITCVIIVLNNSLKKYGAESKYGAEIPISVLGIVMKMNQIVNSIVLGIAVGSQPIIGFNYGAKQYKRVLETLKYMIKVSLAITFIATLIFQLCPQVIINLFGSKEGPEYNEFARLCFRIFLMFVMLNSVQMLSGIFFQAIGKPIKSTIISLSRQILILIPAMIILPKFFQIKGILYAGPLADFTAFTIAVILLTIEIKNIHKSLKNFDLQK